MGEVRGRGRENPRLIHSEHGVQQEAQSYDSDIMTCAKSLTDCATQLPLGGLRVLMGPGYILIRYGKTGRYRNNCHKGRSSLETQIPRKEVMRAMKGHPGKHQGQSGARGSEGKMWARSFTVVSMGRDR